MSNHSNGSNDLNGSNESSTTTTTTTNNLIIPNNNHRQSIDNIVINIPSLHPNINTNNTNNT
jgi:hypothetical protein